MATLVFHHGALGDSVLIWPTLRGLVASGRGPVGLVAPMSRARLAARFIHGVDAIDGEAADAWRLFVPQTETLSDAWRLRLAGAATVISFVSSGDDAWADNVRRLAPDAAIAFSHTRPPDDWPGHVVDWHVDSLAGQGIEIAPVDASPRTHAQGPLILHPGSGGAAKCWPRERFEALIEHRVGIGRPVEAILGEIELATWPDEAVRRWAAMPDVPLHTPGDLMSLADVIGRAGVYVGNDSGPTHLAAQLGVPTIALSGPTDPRKWRPRGARVTTLCPPAPTDMDWLDVNVVVEATAAW